MKRKRLAVGDWLKYRKQSEKLRFLIPLRSIRNDIVLC